VYRCPNKRVDAQAVYSNNIPSGAFRGYGLGQVIFAVESAMDELAERLGIDPFDLRRRNVVVPGDPFTDAHVADDDLSYGSYGLDQCLDLVQNALASGEGTAAPEGAQWRVGDGMAIAMIATIPPRGHFADASISRDADGDFTLSVGTAEFGNGTSTVHTQIVASELGIEPSRVRLRQSDTDATEYDTGAFGSAGTVVAGLAVLAACRELRSAMAAAPDGRRIVGRGRHDGTPRDGGVLRRHLRHPWAVRRQVDERVTLQPGGSGSCQRHRASVRGAVAWFADDARTGVARAPHLTSMPTVLSGVGAAH
jgi:CO/xanthine dehydrogenase Mo-binding subunit